MKKILSLLFAIFLFVLPALAVEENKVEVLPTEAPASSVDEEVALDEYSPESIAAYYGPMMDQYANEDTQLPKFTANELKLFPQAKEQWDKGKRSKKDVLNPIKDVEIGVYPVNPDDYAGEKVYVLLPVTEINIDEMLAIIEACDKIGLDFDPNMLSYRNCARGGGIETNRFLSKEEAERNSQLADLFRNNKISCDSEFTPLPEDDSIGEVMLNEEKFNGLDSFSFRPYRAMSDEELLLRISAFTKPIENPEKMSAKEAVARKELKRVLNMPLSCTLSYSEIIAASQGNIFLEKYGQQEAYWANFVKGNSENQISYSCTVLTDSDEICQACYTNCLPTSRSNIIGDPYDKKWQDIAIKYVTEARTDGVKIKEVESRGETLVQEKGKGVTIWLLCEDDSFYIVRISYQTDEAGSIEYYKTMPDYSKLWEGYYVNN